MIVVADTNVLVSGLLSPFNAPGRIVQMIAAGHLRLAFDARVLAEYDAVLARPQFAFAAHLRESLLEQIRQYGLLAMTKPLARSLPDSDDNAFLEVAIAAAATNLISGNKKHYPPQLCSGINVISPADFIKVRLP